MRQLRFYVDFELLVGDKYQISEDKSRHMVQVLRLGVGAEIILFNGDGREYFARLVTSEKKSVTVQILNSSIVSRESPVQVRLLQGLSKGDRMDITIQKCVELGVTHITPLNTVRSNLKLDENRVLKKHAHWKGITVSACEQSGRNVIPILDAPVGYVATISGLKSSSELKLILHPRDGQQLHRVSSHPQKITLLVGPEGGFDQFELNLAEQCGFISLSLGPRILRTETAAIVAIAGIQSKWGDI